MATKTRRPVGEKSKRKSSVPALVMIGCLFIGVALGKLLGNIVAGTLIGLGTGFIAMAVLRFIMNAKKMRGEDHNTEEHH